MMPRHETILRKEVEKTLVGQGYRVKDGMFYFDEAGREEKRCLHKFARAERIKENINFIETFTPTAREYIRDSARINVAKIKPKLIAVAPNTLHGNLFRWWNLVWWSLPHERAYGRQMRFMVWDDYHKSPIGLIGLQSPILSWRVRDEFLGVTAEKRDYWINQSMSAQRLGALPPYNNFLGGKLVALLMMSDDVREAFKKKYHNKTTLLLRRTLPADLLFITTTGAYGKSSVYNRLKFGDAKICDFIGYTSGHGSFHIPNTLYESFINYLRKEGHKAGRCYGNGPSVKMKNIDQAMKLLGFKGGCEHGMKRAVYLFSFTQNLNASIQGKETPIWHNRNIGELTEYWKERWACKRVGDNRKNFFDTDEYFPKLVRGFG